MNSVYDKDINNQPICKLPWKVFEILGVHHLSFFSSQDELAHCRQ